MDEDSAAVRRDVSGLVVARVGRVVATGDPVLPWAVLDGAGAPVVPVAEFLRDLLACGSSPASCRSYGFDLLRWFRFLAAVEPIGIVRSGARSAISCCGCGCVTTLPVIVGVLTRPRRAR